MSEQDNGNGPKKAAGLTPGMHVTPQTVSFGCGTHYTPDGKEWKILHFEHGAGSTVLMMPVDMARQIGQMVTDEANRHPGPGIIVPTMQQIDLKDGQQ